MQIQADRALIPANADAVRYLTISIGAPERERSADRPATAVSLVLDRSGSMAGTKMAMARKAVEHAVQLLSDRDRLAVVVYDTEIDVVLDRTAATREAKQLAMTRLAAIDARGGTDLAGGWLEGAKCAPDRVLLLTDGLANHGITDQDQLAARAAALKARGITTSTFGVGADFDERLLARLATEGGGHFYYIETARQIPDLLASELGETLEVVAHAACLEIVCGNGTDAAVINDFPVERAGALLRVQLGDLTAGQELTIVVAISCSGRSAGDTAFVDCRLTDRDAALYPGTLRVDWTAAIPGADEAQPVDLGVCRVVAGLLAARARAAAIEMNRSGQFDEASALLRRAADAIRSLAPGDAAVSAIAAALLSEVVEYAQPLMARELKERHFASYSALRDRGRQGKAKRKAVVK
jgi:Ca-activated chloride channel family protein